MDKTVKKVLWISRHSMSAGQLADLGRVMGGPVRLIPWQKTLEDPRELLPELEDCDAVAAVLPPELLGKLLKLAGGGSRSSAPSPNGSPPDGPSFPPPVSRSRNSASSIWAGSRCCGWRSSPKNSDVFLPQRRIPRKSVSNGYRKRDRPQARSPKHNRQGRMPERSASMDTCKLTAEQLINCHAIIHTASVASGVVGLGLAQIPLSDNALITPIQITMTVLLGRVFGVELTRTAAEAPLVSAAAATVGRAASQALVGWIPGVGNIINCGTAAGLTEAIGWLLVAQFANGIAVY